MKTYENHSLLPYNTFGIDVDASYLVEYDSEEELVQLLQLDLLRENKFLHIGGGSNLLFIGNYQGVILHSHIMGIEVKKTTETDVFVKVGAGVVWDDFVAYCVAKNYGGVENLSLIPGEVGATPIQNIGAYGVEVKDVIYKVECIEVETGQKRIFTNPECQFAYRNSIFKHQLKGKYIVTAVWYKLSRNPQLNVNYGSLSDEIKKYPEITLQSVRNAVISIRQRKLPEPKVLGNAGSFFLNPVVDKAHFEQLQQQYPNMPFYAQDDNKVKIPAGWLIEQCGWKGKSVGKVAVHGSQALVLINKGGANGLDIINLSDSIRASVREKFQIELTPEVNLIFG
ncbi:MAG: UDP-N-acetylmuramate dehydrogenase [Paludibacteraceae bacterium]|nr:UDP-N-acetylmuramate dehydrogenase [Paludibacteraceae bacterium]